MPYIEREATATRCHTPSAWRMAAAKYLAFVSKSLAVFRLVPFLFKCIGEHKKRKRKKKKKNRNLQNDLKWEEIQNFDL